MATLLNMLRAGQIIADRYRLEHELGRGGMAAVWSAREIDEDRLVALKLIDPDLTSLPDAALRLEREARVASALIHPNVVRIHDFGVSGAQPFLAMELLSGPTLRSVSSSEVPTIARSLALLDQVAAALSCAHRMGLVHRDVKPDNVIVEPRLEGGERAVIVDFGLAFVAGARDLGRFTLTGMALGTPAYMSPEQAFGETLGPPADVYSFACMAYELFTGAPPFRGDRVELFELHLSSLPRPIRALRADVPRALGAALLAALAKDPSARPTMTALRMAIARSRSERADPRDGEAIAPDQRDVPTVVGKTAPRAAPGAHVPR